MRLSGERWASLEKLLLNRARRIFEEGIGGFFSGEEIGRGSEGFQSFEEIGLLLVRCEDGRHAVMDGGDEGIRLSGEHGEATTLFG